MSPDDSLALARKYCPDESRTGNETRLIELTEKVDHLPLAIVRAGTFISTKMLNVEEYLNWFRDNPEEALAQTLVTEDESVTTRSAINSILLSVHNVMDKGNPAGDLLALMSQFDRHAIPERLLRKGFPELSAMAFHNALVELRNYALIRENESGKAGVSLSMPTETTWELHQLDQLVTRKWLEKHGQSIKWSDAAITTIAELFPSPGWAMDQWPTSAALFPHVLVSLKQVHKSRDNAIPRGTLLHKVADYLWEQGDYDRAKLIVEDTIKTWEERTEDCMDALLKSRVLLVMIHNERQEYDDAIGLAEQDISAINALGLEKSRSRNFFKALSTAYAGVGRLDDVQHAIERVLIAERKISGIDDLATLHCEFLMAIILNKKGEYKEAAKLLQHAKSIQLTQLRLETLRILHKLSSVFFAHGLWREAEDLLKDYLRLSMAVYSNKLTFSSWLWIVRDLAVCYVQQGQFKKAERLVRYALLREKEGGQKDQSSELGLEMDLAKFLFYQDRDDEAKKLLADAVRSANPSLGSVHPEIVKCEDLLFKWESSAARADIKAELRAQINDYISRSSEQERSTTQGDCIWQPNKPPVQNDSECAVVQNGNPISVGESGLCYDELTRSLANLRCPEPSTNQKKLEDVSPAANQNKRKY